MVPEAEINQVVWKTFHFGKNDFDAKQKLKAVKPVVEMKNRYVTEMALRLEFDDNEVCSAE